MNSPSTCLFLSFVLPLMVLCFHSGSCCPPSPPPPAQLLAKLPTASCLDAWLQQLVSVLQSLEQRLPALEAFSHSSTPFATLTPQGVSFSSELGHTYAAVSTASDGAAVRLCLCRGNLGFVSYLFVFICYDSFLCYDRSIVPDLCVRSECGGVIAGLI